MDPRLRGDDEARHAGPRTTDHGLFLLLFSFFIRLRPKLVWGFAALMVLPFAFASAQPAADLFDRFTIADGLPENTVQVILQDHLGYLWFGTQNGLVRYDGFEMKTFHFEGRGVTALSEDPSGDLWVGAQSRDVFLARFHRDTESFSYYQPDSSTGARELADLTVNSLLADQHGNVWIVTYGGPLFHLNAATGRIERIRHDPGDLTSLSANRVGLWGIHTDLLQTALLEDSNGNVWIGTRGGGLNRYNPSTDDFTRYTTAKFLSESQLVSQVDSLSRHAKPLAAIVGVGNDVDSTRSLTLQESTSVLIAGLGEGIPGGPLLDYGWIETGAGQSVWTMRSDDSFWAGGGDKNRMTVTTTKLPKGNYRLRYRSDDSHASGTWNTWPPNNPSWWGVQVFEINGLNMPALEGKAADPTVISNDFVIDLHEDRAGRLWVGTRSGLDLFDPETGSFTHYGPGDPGEDSPLGVERIYDDQDGFIWATLRSGELRRLDPATGVWTSFPVEQEDPRYLLIPIHEEDGLLWALERSNESWTLVQIDPVSRRISRLKTLDVPIAAPLADRSGVFWWGALQQGLFRFDPAKHRFPHFAHVPGDPSSLGHPTVNVVYEDRAGTIWVTTQGGGLNRFERESGTFTQFRHDPRVAGTISSDVTGPMLEDYSGTFWIGTLAGLDMMDRTTGRFRTFMPRSDHKGDRDYNGVVAIHEDKEGRLWAVTRRGLHRFDRQRERFESFSHDSTDRIPLGGPWDTTVLEDHLGRLWLNTRFSGSGLYRFDPRLKTFTRFAADPTKPGMLSEGRPTCWYEDSSGTLWIGTDGGGINRFDPQTDAFSSYRDQLTGLRSVQGIIDDKAGKFWLPTYTGGLHLFDPATGSSRLFSLKDGLPHTSLAPSLVDDFGMLWIPTANGLTRFDPDSLQFRTYTVEDGLRQNDLSRLLKSSSGELYFRTNDGFHAFRPEDLRDNPHAPEVALTGLSISNVEVPVGPDAPLKHHISLTDAVTLGHDQNDLAIEYMGFRFSRPERTTYAYKLEPYQDDWVEVGTERTARYPNLDPGRYTFRVKAANADGVWNEEGATLRITVNPPWWQTGWAYSLYGMLFLAGLFGLVVGQRRMVVRKERERTRERELEDAKKIETAHKNLEVAFDKLKSAQNQLVQSEKMASLGQLTAGIAHEIKNPLNFVNNFSELSAELAEEIEEDLDTFRDELPESFVRELDELLASLKENSAQITEHGKRADAIVKSMLQHARTGTGEREPVDLNRLLDEHIDLAWHGAQARDRAFDLTIDRDFDDSVGEVHIVPQEIGRVVVNLLNNAFDALREEVRKNGSAISPRVTVSTRRLDDQIEIRVADNGPGIPANVRAKIFEPFFTTKPTGSSTGLGLSISYDIVTKGHGGVMEVVSEEGDGVAFVVRLPTERRRNDE